MYRKIEVKYTTTINNIYTSIGIGTLIRKILFLKLIKTNDNQQKQPAAAAGKMKLVFYTKKNFFQF